METSDNQRWHQTSDKLTDNTDNRKKAQKKMQIQFGNEMLVYVEQLSNSY